MFPDVYNSSWKYKSRSKITTIYNRSNSPIIPSYTKQVFLFLSIEIGITVLVIMILSIPFIAGYLSNSWTVFPWVLIWSAFALTMLIIFYQEIRDEHPLNISLLVIYSILIGTAIGISVSYLCFHVKVTAIAITLIYFICSILIGAAIRTRIADRFLLILTCIVILSTAFMAAAIVFYVSGLWVAVIALHVGAEILLFLITICFSQFTVGKSQVRISFPHWTLAALVLYSLFCIDLSNSLYLIDIFNCHIVNKTNCTCW
ncbi:unnamed protein product [Schistosoma margrebowiei]|uniref:Uncharacterized protein n=1 Tax=Schistosoma margrebowiei TaxID=48269 RepID=A0AA85AIW8_9TREM|nr:unnamed protein product [Schistosoma margrebowiei]